MHCSCFVDKSMLAGVEDLASLMNQDTAENVLTQLVHVIRSHIPYAGLLGQVGRSYRR